MNKILVMMSALMLFASPMIASAISTGDDITPANVNVNYVLTLNTGFSVVSPSEMTFRAKANGTAQTVEAEGQNKSIDKPWGNISNNGEISMDFYVYLNTGNANDVILKIDDNNAMSIPITLNTDGQSIGSASPGAKITLFATADFSSPAPDERGTTSRKLQVSTYVPIWNLTLSPTSAILEPTEVMSFTVASVDQNGNPLDATVDWSSSNVTVGSIVNGFFTSSGPEGTTTIWANGTRGTTNLNRSATITVAIPPPPEEYI